MRGSQLNSTRVSHGSHAVPPEQYASLTWVPHGSLMNSTWAPHGAMAHKSSPNLGPLVYVSMLEVLPPISLGQKNFLLFCIITMRVGTN